MRLRSLVAVAISITLLLVTAAGREAVAAGVVGTGTAGSCTETAFDTALAGFGAVTFNCGAAPVTITFTSQKVITGNTTIDGGGLITLSGGNATRLFSVGNGISLSVEDIVLADGYTENVNAGAAITGGGSIVTLTRTTVRNNTTTPYGCAAVNMSGGTLNAFDTTFSGNNAGATGGAICGNNDSTMHLYNCTLSGNSAGGAGAVFSSGTLTLNNCTVADNTSVGTGAVSSFGTGATTTLSNTIVADNGLNCGAAAGGQIVDGGNNLQYPATSCGATIPEDDPLLQPLAGNGGPTQTMALGTGSPAIDGGANITCQAADQRGEPRTDGDGDGTVTCDIGAYEAPTFVPSEGVPALDWAGLVGLAALLALGALLAVNRRG